MKATLLLFALALCLPFASLAQQGTCLWRITFTYTETKNSSTQSPTTDETYALQMNGSVSMLVEAGLPFDHGHVIIKTPQDPVKSFSTTGSVSEKITADSKEPAIGISETRKDNYHGSPDLSEQGVEFEYDPAGAQYINAGIRFNKKGNYEIKEIHARPGETPRNFSSTIDDDFGAYTASIGSSDDKIRVLKNGFTIDGRKEKTIDEPLTAGGNRKTTHTVEYHVTIIRESDIIAVIEPIKGFENYRQWLPEGPDPATPGSTGNSVSFRIYLLDKKKPGQKITDGITSVKYYFGESVSHEPGYAMNFPATNPDTRADLQLGKLTDRADNSREITEINITGAGPGMPVKVESFDYGGYGKLQASVTLGTGDVLQAMDLNSKKTYMPVPYREDDRSQVADIWKAANKAKDLDDDYDDEKGQDGVGDEHNGDGLSLYEEYRGFIENKKHIRTNPLKKDLMVCSKLENDHWPNGINIFSSVTGIVVHYKFKEDEFGQPDNRNDQFANDRVINFNFSKRELHVVNQHGLAMVIDNSISYAEATHYTGISGKMGTPKDFKYLRVGSGFSPDISGYNVVRADVNDDGTFTINPNGRGVIYTDEYGVTIAHEMLHCCNVWHHGDRDITRTWQQQANGSVKELNYDDNGTLLSQRNIVVINEDGTPCTNWGADQNGIRVMNIGLKNGQCSGVEDCIMRYDNTSVYAETEQAATRYFMPRGASTAASHANGQHNYAEITGISLCDEAEGTGVNKATRSPRPRYGDADQNAPRGRTSRGNCKKQVCINDKYH